MTEHEKKILFPYTKQILQGLGYNTDENIHQQFIKKFYKQLYETPTLKRKGPKKKLK